jgi:hypothetical protein
MPKASKTSTRPRNDTASATRPPQSWRRRRPGAAARAARRVSTKAATEHAVMIATAGATAGPAAKNRRPDGVCTTPATAHGVASATIMNPTATALVSAITAR